MSRYNLSHIEKLEADSIYILREAGSHFKNTALLFSGGKDSIVLAHLARKAFSPAKIPFQFLHIDTGNNFPETIEFRDQLVNKLGVQLIVGDVQNHIDKHKINELKPGGRNRIQSSCLLETISEQNYDSSIGGGRRDEEKARAKERIFSHRDKSGFWQPANQRPEIWNLYNSRINQDEHIRIFPLSNWTEMDVWNYIKEEKIEIPSLYFSHSRKCVILNNLIIADSEYLEIDSHIPRQELQVRYRTLGDMNTSGAIESQADSVERVIEELSCSTKSERGNRLDDKNSQSAMEDRKTEGYF